MALVKLKDVAVVQAGLSFRSRIEPACDGDIAVIQMRDLAKGRRLGTARHLVVVALENVSSGHFVKRRDLVFRSRGKTTTTAIIDVDTERVVVAAPLLRIRVATPGVLPEYLHWFIDQPRAQTFLHRRAAGTATIMVGKPALEALEIPLPDVETQERIIDLASLCDEEQCLMREVSMARKRWIDGALMQLATESTGSLMNAEVPGRPGDIAGHMSVTH